MEHVSGEKFAKLVSEGKFPEHLLRARPDLPELARISTRKIRFAFVAGIFLAALVGVVAWALIPGDVVERFLFSFLPAGMAFLFSTALLLVMGDENAWRGLCSYKSHLRSLLIALNLSFKELLSLGETEFNERLRAWLLKLELDTRELESQVPDMPLVVRREIELLAPGATRTGTPYSNYLHARKELAGQHALLEVLGLAERARRED